MPDPNGIAFSPDYKKLYVVSTGRGPGDAGPGGKSNVFVFDVTADNRTANGRVFSEFMIDGVKCGPDGVRCDVDGNVWCSSNAGRAVGYSGVTVGRRRAIDRRIRLPKSAGACASRTEAQSPVHGHEPIDLRVHKHQGLAP